MSARSVAYVRVCEEEDGEPVELPAEEDGSVLLSTVSAQFYGCTGLKYRPQGSQSFRGLRLADDRLYPPADGGWGRHTYLCVFPKRRPAPDSPDRNRCSDLIVLGLPWKTDEEGLREYFRSFGELLLSQIKRDPETGSSKGFGFVKFKERAAQTKALSQRHLIDGRWCDVRVPNSKEGPAPRVPGKVFVGRCTEAITPDDLREHFAQFGQVTDVFVPKPFRAFGFVTFLDPEVARGLCGEDHIVKGVSVNVSDASPKRDRHQRQGGRPSPDRRRRVQHQQRQRARPGHPWPADADQGSRMALGAGSVPVDRALVAAALNRAGWGLAVAGGDGYRGPPAQPPPPQPHQRGGYVSWAPPPPPPNGGQDSQWPHRPDGAVKGYVKYE